MDSWDTFTLILKDYYLHEFLNKIYRNKDLTDKKGNEDNHPWNSTRMKIK